MFPVHEPRFNSRANRIILFLQDISFFFAEGDFVIARFPANLTKSFSLCRGTPLFEKPTPKKP